MTIARPSSGPGFHGDHDGARHRLAGAGWSAATVSTAVPRAIREDRLAGQIAAFVRAGYRLETTSGLQAVMARDRTPRPFRTAVLTVVTLGLFLLPRLIGGGRGVQRVVITIDSSGAVRLA